MTALISARVADHTVAPPSTSTPLIGVFPAGARIPHAIGGRLTAPVVIGLTATDHNNDAAVEEDRDRGSSFARCSDGHGTLAHLFFSDDDYELARAKAICGRCGLAESCLAGAIDRAEAYGVWGAKLVLDGVPVEVKAKRGRPRKHPNPVLVVDEVPIPKHLVA